MNKVYLMALGIFFFISCGKSKSNAGEDFSKPSSTEASTDNNSDAPSYDPKRGEGKFSTINLGTGLDLAMAADGEKVAGVKCMSCHKLTDERLVGPGWKGVTKRRAPEWIMNFATNPDPMIDKDPELQAQLELCLLRMPNQSISDEEARHIVEFMRQNDGVK